MKRPVLQSQSARPNQLVSVLNFLPDLHDSNMQAQKDAGWGRTGGRRKHKRESCRPSTARIEGGANAPVFRSWADIMFPACCNNGSSNSCTKMRRAKLPEDTASQTPMKDIILFLCNKTLTYCEMSACPP